MKKIYIQPSVYVKNIRTEHSILLLTLSVSEGTSGDVADTKEEDGTCDDVWGQEW